MFLWTCFKHRVVKGQIFLKFICSESWTLLSDVRLVLFFYVSVAQISWKIFSFRIWSDIVSDLVQLQTASSYTDEIYYVHFIHFACPLMEASCGNICYFNGSYEKVESSSNFKKNCEEILPENHGLETAGTPGYRNVWAEEVCLLGRHKLWSNCGTVMKSKSILWSPLFGAWEQTTVHGSNR